MKYLPVILSGLCICLSSISFAAEESNAPIKITPYQPGITMTRSVQAGISPEQAIQILKAGNVRYQSGKTLQRDVKKLVTQTALGQYPLANIVACMDSRSGPEIIFDQSTGDIFSNRVAGNVINKDILGSLEYGAKVAGAPLIVVLGHTNCGAIKGACDGVEMGNLTGLLEKIKPAVQMSKAPGEHNGKNYTFVNEVTEINVDDSIANIRANSAILSNLESHGKLKIVGAIYDTSTGKVIWR
ncbi:carbonic anhydrase family protein [Polynucleobacter parvulilacunae]|uniref:carbonic anhydrase family protein n=1 Tax=Polynucleobacter parvulilacunae TaxID=1855631 RepID=UPI001C0D696B|nr:carbonic anhydrase family protein [Polynucleobacter parvulilacunae]